MSWTIEQTFISGPLHNEVLEVPFFVQWLHVTDGDTVYSYERNAGSSRYFILRTERVISSGADNGRADVPVART